MEFMLVIGLVLAIVLVVLAIRAISGIVKVAMAIIGILFLLGVFITVLLLIDVRQARIAINQGDKVLLYGQNEDVLVGVRMEYGAGSVSYGANYGSSFPKGISALGESDLRRYEAAFANGSLEGSKQEVVFLMNESVFKEVMMLHVGSYSIPGALVLKALASEDSKETLAEGLKMPVAAIRDAIPASEQDTKAILLLLLFDQVQKEQGVKYILKKVQTGEIAILPTFLTIKFLKMVPQSVVERTVDRILAKEEAKQGSIGNRSDANGKAVKVA